MLRKKILKIMTYSFTLAVTFAKTERFENYMCLCGSVIRNTRCNNAPLTFSLHFRNYL